MAHYRVGAELYDMDPTVWPNVDVSAVQRALGCGLAEFMERMEKMDVDAIQAMIWVLRRRNEPGLRLDAVSFTIREFTESIELTDTDIRDAWAGIKAEDRPALIEQMTDEQRARLIDANGELIREETVPLDASPATAA